MGAGKSGTGSLKGVLASKMAEQGKTTNKNVGPMTTELEQYIQKNQDPTAPLPLGQIGTTNTKVTQTVKLPGVLKGQLKSGVAKPNGVGNKPSSGSQVGFGVGTADAFLQYFRNITSSQAPRIEFRNIFENIDRELARENDISAENSEIKKQNYLGDKSKERMADITVPVVYPQTQAAFAYLVGVFLTGQPIFEAVADLTNATSATQLNAVISENSTKSGWVRHIALCLYDALRYNLCALETNWDQKLTYSITTDPNSLSGASKNKQISWEGNCMKRIDLYNAIWDTRVHPAEIHEKGEYAGYTEIISRILLKQEVQNLNPANTMNLREAFESFRGGIAGDLFYVPQVTRKLNLDPRQNELNWMNWAINVNNRNVINYKGVYERTILYVRIIPSDFDLSVPAKNTVQVWKLIIINGMVVIYAERMTNAHSYFPMLFAQPLEDGLDYQTKSFAENIVDVQTMASQLWNIRIASARRNVSDRAVYDPTKIDPKDINSSSPNAKIPMKPSSYGRPISDSFMSIPFNDQSSASLVPDALRVVDLGRTITGINAPQEGTFIKGNRTQSEFQTISSNANNRLQTMAQFLEAQFFTPLKEILKINMLQYQKPGSYFSKETGGNVTVDPVALRQAIMTFKMSDGLLPVDKLVDTDFLQVVLQAAMTNQELMMEFDPVKLLDYIASLKNVPDLAQFQRDPTQSAAYKMQQLKNQGQNPGQSPQGQNPNAPPTQNGPGGPA